MADTNHGKSRRIANYVVIVAALVVLALALLNPQRTTLTWVEAALAAFLAIYSGYLIIRSRRANAPDDPQ
ncbi:hypothetical protein CIW49_05620 [Mycolicibacterium sp. P1-18]|uniref:hypothetical protein n=1 Tax=Mycolicibacterium sp. P1-18 TaxID=2024615 RepID=UPI0011F2E3F2|nr:hypothetical protein [Mycolicibacterium sp. P1-18]KAA0101001.1 hypothetical protein CIW49_05620 [Mycolicibacterium sp. P1-18]